MIRERTKRMPTAVALVVLAIFLAILALGIRAARAYAADSPVVVSLGDSYSSGEGTEPFYEQDNPNKYNQNDWLAHRSQLAWPGRLQLRGSKLSTLKDSGWYFAAASGAKIENVTTSSQRIVWIAGTEEGQSGTKDLPVQLQVFDALGQSTVDYVTLSVGGNDFGFTDILTIAATQNIPFVSSGSLGERIEQALQDLETTILPQLSQAYEVILNKAGGKAKLVVVGYPHLISENVEGSLFDATEAKQLNDAVDKLNEGIKRAVNGLSNDNVVFCDPRPAFAGHEAYAEDAYINEILLGAQSQELDQTLSPVLPSAYSIHPNVKGQAAYASAVQSIIDTLEAEAEPEPEPKPDPIAVQSVQLDRNTIAFTTEGETAQLIATVLPVDADDKSVMWSTTDPAIATVSEDGLVTAVANGSTTITVTTNDGGFSAECAVSVSIPAPPSDVPVTGITLSSSTLTLAAVGETYQLVATVMPEDATNKAVMWRSNNADVATVSNAGVVTAVADGTATITAITEDGGFEAACAVSVELPAAVVPVTGISINPTVLTLDTVGARATLVTTVEPADATDKTVVWQSSNEDVATVEADGTVTAMADGTATIVATTVDGGFTAACEVAVSIPVAETRVAYQTHVQTYGWQGWKNDGEPSGTSGQSKRLEGIQIKLNNAPYSGGIAYRTHVQTYGWQDWVADGATSGTEGESKRLEAIEIKLTGDMATYYDVYYRVHAQTYGWMAWAKNGGRSGTATLGKRLEAIQIVVLPKGTAAPGATYCGVTQAISTAYITRQIRYCTHVQTYGWMAWMYDGVISGTSGQSKRLEAIRIELADPLYSGGVTYQTHVQTYGWQDWVSDGAPSGTSGESKRLEAIRIALTGEMELRYDVWYRVHSQTYGWLGWAQNGNAAGTEGLSKRLEGIEIKILPKGSPAPGSTDNFYIKG